jgi:hypothetical protein
MRPNDTPELRNTICKMGAFFVAFTKGFGHNCIFGALYPLRISTVSSGQGFQDFEGCQNSS